MLDEDTFLELHPEFAGGPAGFDVGSILAQQALQVSDSWGDREDLYHELITADALARTPYGRENRMVDKSGNTQWSSTIRQMRAGHAFARSRVG